MINDIKASFYSEFRTRISSSRIFVENFLNPLFILFIFGIAMSDFLGERNIEGAEVPYIVYFLYGSINIGLITSCLVSATRVFLDKYTGLFDYYTSFPISRASIVLGRLLFHIIISLAQILLMITFVYFMYPDYIHFDLNFFLFVIMSIICTSGWFSMIFYIAFSINTQDNFNVFYYLLLTPVIYLSSVYYPIDKFSAPLRVICSINPLTWSTDISRYLMLNIGDDYIVYKVVASILLSFLSLTFVLIKISNWAKA